MSPGDLVNFKSQSWVFRHAERDYKNPGVILKVKVVGDDVILPRKYSAEVMWADGRITWEHNSYLCSAEENTYGDRK